MPTFTEDINKMFKKYVLNIRRLELESIYTAEKRDSGKNKQRNFDLQICSLIPFIDTSF